MKLACFLLQSREGILVLGNGCRKMGENVLLSPRLRRKGREGLGSSGTDSKENAEIEGVRKGALGRIVMSGEKGWQVKPEVLGS